MKICEEFWDEFLLNAKLVYLLDREADIYDVFEFIRYHQQGASPFSENFLKRIDAEIEKEEGPFGYRHVMG
jgi:hypothetical protein